MNSNIFVVIDFEANCWNYKRKRKHINEIIEIGAVILRKENDNFIRLGEFTETVKPLEDPILSKFCKKLTGITQEEVNKSERFPVVFEKLLKKVNDLTNAKYECISVVNWGNSDKSLLKKNCRLHKITSPFFKFIYLDKKFAKYYRLGISCKLSNALFMLGTEFVGQQHRALDDAINTSFILEKKGINLLLKNNFNKMYAS